MKVYVADGSQEEIAEMAKICLEKGWRLRSMSRIGRPRRNDPVQKVLDAYEGLKTMRAVARALDMSPGTVSRILHQADAVEKLRFSTAQQNRPKASQG